MNANVSLPHLQTAVFQHYVQLLVYNECFHTSICVNMTEFGENRRDSLINNCRYCMKCALAFVNVWHVCYIQINVDSLYNTLRITTFKSGPIMFISLLLWQLYHGGGVLSWTHCVSTSVHWKIYTCYKCCCIRCQEGDSMSYFLYFPWSAESMGHLGFLKELQQSKKHMTCD